MGTLLRFKKKSLFLFALFEIVLLLIPLPFVRAAWDYFGPPQDYGVVAFYLIAYGSYFAAANEFLEIAERFWNRVNPKPEPSAEPSRVSVQSLPPLRAVHSLPPCPLDFTGRTNEINQILNDMPSRTQVAIAGITGMGGIGKTALALAVAHKLSSRYSDAQIYLELRGTTRSPISSKQAMIKIIRSFEPTADLENVSEAEIAGQYRSLLDGRSVLLLLDNASDAAQVQSLVPPSTCALILTSRFQFALPGMRPLRLDVMSPQDARSFLVKVCSRIELNADKIATLCGYLPLALRIAGSTLVERSDIDTKQYAQSLSDKRSRLAKLRLAGDPTLDVRAAFELSYDLLSPTSKACWRALAVFAGPFYWTATAEVWALSDATTRQTLSDFLRFSFIDFDKENERYFLHELLMDFGDSLLSGKERETAKWRHATHYLAAAYFTHRLYMQGGSAIIQALSVFDHEWLNIQAAFEGSVAGTQSKTKAAKICNELGYAALHCMGHRLNASERIQWFEHALTASRKLRDKVGESTHLGNLGNAYLERGDIPHAIELLEQALSLERETGYKEGQAKSLGNLGAVMLKTGKIQNGIDLITQALQIHTEIGNLRSQATDLGNLGNAYRDLGQVPLAFSFHSRALLLARTTGDKKGEALWLIVLGDDLSRLGLRDRASGLHKDALAISRQLGDKTMEGMALTEVGSDLLNPSDVQTAIQYFEEALAKARQTGDKVNEAMYLGNLGLAYAGLGNREKALDLYQQALAFERGTGDRNLEANGLSRFGRLYLFLGDVPNAIHYLEQVCTIYHELGHKQEESRTLGLLGDIHRRSSRITEAEEMYKKAVQIDPSNGWTLTDLIWLYHKEDRESEAIPYLEDASKRDPSNPDSLLVLASIYKKLGNSAAMNDYASRARAQIPPNAWYWLASVESICGNVDLAFDYLRRAVEEAGLDRAGVWRNWNLDWIRNDPRFEQIVGPRPK